uniref:Rad60/SUMO-like domain-containing protein n=1 Tax=Gorilla gorilla gorilla TaxID=9595 RepID=A0A2I2YAH5_GORGO
MAHEKPKEGVKTESNDYIDLKVVGQDGSVVQFKIKRHTPLSKLIKAYCERQGLNCQTVFQSSCAILHSHQQQMKVPVPYPCQHLVL